jgi:hypothetical protein
VLGLVSDPAPTRKRSEARLFSAARRRTAMLNRGRAQSPLLTCSIISIRCSLCCDQHPPLASLVIFTHISVCSRRIAVVCILPQANIARELVYLDAISLFVYGRPPREFWLHNIGICHGLRTQHFREPHADRYPSHGSCSCHLRADLTYLWTSLASPLSCSRRELHKAPLSLATFKLAVVLVYTTHEAEAL